MPLSVAGIATKPTKETWWVSQSHEITFPRRDLVTQPETDLMMMMMMKVNGHGSG